MKKEILSELFLNYVKDTEAKAIITNVTVFLCRLTYTVQDAIGLNTWKIYVNTRVLKHLYDSKPAEEFHFVVKHLHKIVKYPDHIYENKNSKRGNCCFVKQLKGEYYFCSLEAVDNGDQATEENPSGIYVVTAFRLRKEKRENYLKNYKLMWSWRGDKSSS